MDENTGGRNRSGVEAGGLPRQSSSANLNSSMSERFCTMNVSRVNALGAIVNRHSDAIAKVLLSSKESSEKKASIEAAFRACRDAFMEVSSVLINMIDGNTGSSSLTVEDVRKIIEEELNVFGKKSMQCCTSNDGHGGASHASSSTDRERSYASVIKDVGPEIRVSRGPAVKLDSTTSFLVLPNKNKQDIFTSSNKTRETLCKVLKPADYGLKIKRMTPAKNNGIKIDALSPNIEKIKAHPGLAAVGLEIKENVKMNPRLIIHSVPNEMTDVEIKSELIAQNLSDSDPGDVKVIYVFKPRPGKQAKSCIVEVAPGVRRMLLGNGRVYLRYAACPLADHVRVLQCYRCLSFGHIAKDCKLEPHCGHCSGEHEMRYCTRRDQRPKCFNCGRQGVQGDLAHAATDTIVCPILGRKIGDKVTNINYA